MHPNRNFVLKAGTQMVIIMMQHFSLLLHLFLSMMIGACFSVSDTHYYYPQQTTTKTTIVSSSSSGAASSSLSPPFSLLLPELQEKQNKQRVSDIVDMHKTIYSVLSQYDEEKVPEEISSRFKSEFQRLDTDGTLGSTLDSLYEMRLLDLQISVQHAKRMRRVLDDLNALRIAPQLPLLPLAVMNSDSDDFFNDFSSE